MKTISITALSIIALFGQIAFAQEPTTKNNPNSFTEQFGNTLNVGIGIGYYGYIGYSIPVVHADYEFQVARNFTLAPFITYYTYHNNYYWGETINTLINTMIIDKR